MLFNLKQFRNVLLREMDWKPMLLWYRFLELHFYKCARARYLKIAPYLIRGIHEYKFVCSDCAQDFFTEFTSFVTARVYKKQQIGASRLDKQPISPQ